MGVKGAAVATVITQVLMCLLGFIHLKINKDAIKLNLKSFIYIKWEKSVIKRIYSIATPAVVGQMGTALGFIILNTFIQS